MVLKPEINIRGNKAGQVRAFLVYSGDRVWIVQAGPRGRVQSALFCGGENDIVLALVFYGHTYVGTGCE